MDCCKRKISEVLAARELYSLNCLLLAKQIFYLCSCSQKNRSALMLANARKDNSSTLLTGNVRFTQRLSSKISVRINRYGIENELIRTAQNNSYG